MYQCKKALRLYIAWNISEMRSITSPIAVVFPTRAADFSKLPKGMGQTADLMFFDKIARVQILESQIG
jgi:hypothetical protein